MFESISKVSITLSKFIDALDPAVCSQQNNKGNVFNRSIEYGKFKVIGAARDSIKLCENELEEDLESIKKTIKDFKISYKTISGTEYLIELKRNRIAPTNWVLISQTKAFSRYHTPGTLVLLKKLAIQRERLDQYIKESWNKFLSELRDCYGGLRNALLAISRFDCLFSMAKLQQSNNNYIFPTIDPHSKAFIEVKNGCNPIVSSIISESYVPNDINLSTKERCTRHVVLTGPNMGGKSCYMKQVALIVLMAQTGAPIPATFAHLGLFI